MRRLFTPLSFGEGPGVRWLLAVLLLLFSLSSHAQEATDSAKTVKPADIQAPAVKTPSSDAGAAADTTQPKDKKAEEKKSKKKKKEKAETPKEDAAPAAGVPATDSTAADSSKITIKGKKNSKTTSAKAAPPKKPAKKAAPEPELHIVAGAETRANENCKDKEDRTLKGPSGQKVYTSPKGGKYYFNINGTQIFLKKDNQK